MTKKIKKQSLLGKTPEKKSPARPSVKRGVAKQAPTSPQSPINAPVESNKSKTKWYVLALIILMLLFTPKPTLLTYEKLGLVANSIYWPGFFGFGATLLDSTLEPKANLERGTLYLCQDLSQPASCQKYNITQQHGFIAALRKLLLD